MKDRTLLSAAVLALGLLLAGVFIGRGFVASRTADHFVTVKGLAEREVIADIALWPLRFVATHDDLGQAQTKIQRSKEAILAFLQRHGIEATQVELQGLEVTDVLANPYRNGGPVESRYIIRQSLMVRSSDPERIESASQDIGELVEAGVILSSEGGPSSGPTYLFTKLNELKPALIAEGRRAVRQGLRRAAGRDPAGEPGLDPDPGARPGAGRDGGESAQQDRARGGDDRLLPGRLATAPSANPAAGTRRGPPAARSGPSPCSRSRRRR
jgi:hypothetical protein